MYDKWQWLISSRRKNNTVKIPVGNEKIASKMIIRHVVVIGAKLRFKGHLDYALKNVGKASMMPNIGGLKYSQRLLIGGAVWMKALENTVN